MAQRQEHMSDSHSNLGQDPETQQNCLNTEAENVQHMSVLQKLAINASLWGIEACCNFEQLYTVPILQSLGLPLRLVSLTGAIAGPTGALLLPILGWLTDRGSNPHTRKIKAAVFGSGVIFCGMACVITANILHLNFLLQFAANRTSDDDRGNISVPHGMACFSSSSERGDGGTPWGPMVNTSEGGTGPGVGSLRTSPLETEASDSEVPFKAVLGLMGFVVLDFGYDACNAFVKSLVLSCGPRSEHTSLMVIGLITASSGGVFTAAVGLMDVSSLLGLSHIEGGRLAIQTTVQGIITIMFVAMGLLISLLTIRRLLSIRLTALKGTTCIRKPPDSRPHASHPMTKHPLNNHVEQFAQSPMLDAFENSIRSFGGGAVHFVPNLALLEAGHSQQSTPTTEHAPLPGDERVPTEDDEDTERSPPAPVPVSNRRKDSLPSIPEHLEIGAHSLPNHPATEESHQSHSQHYHSHQGTSTEHTPLLGAVQVIKQDADDLEDAEEMAQFPPTSVSVSHKWSKSLPSIPEHIDIEGNYSKSLPNHLAVEASQNSHSHHHHSHQCTPTEHTPSLGAENVIQKDAEYMEDAEDKELSPPAFVSVSHRLNKSLSGIPKHLETGEHSSKPQPIYLAAEESQNSPSHYYHSHQCTPTEHTPLLGGEQVIKEDACDLEDAEDMERSPPAPLSVSYRRKDSLPRQSEHLKAEAGSSCCERGFKVKIFLITVATYFSTSDLFLFSMTSSDFVGKAIYGGDPAAQPGSQSLTLYQDGVRMASVGSVVHYSCFLLISFLQSRILAYIGCRVEFTLAHLLMSATLVALSLSERLEVYFLLTVVAGFHRTCIFSIPFTVANDLIQARMSERGQGKSSLGLAFSLLSASMPLSYCTLYSWIGPVEEFTGMVAVPFWLGSLTSVLSALTFLAVGKV